MTTDTPPTVPAGEAGNEPVGDDVHGDEQRDDKRKPSQATSLVELAETNYRFGVSTSGEPFGVATDGAYVARMLRGGQQSLRAELAQTFMALHGKAAASSALADAMLVLEGRAQAGDRTELALRVAGHDGRVVLDLGDDTGRVVVVEPGGWQVVDRSPILFRRTELTGPLPTPAAVGDLGLLRRLLNVTAGDWPLLTGWLVAALVERMPHPIALLTGEQGTGKTAAARLATVTVDPSPAPTRTCPRDPEGWAVAAAGSWTVALDNISRIPEWLSDSLCRAVTGDGLVKRRLYSDSSLTVLAFRRVVMLTAIDAGALRGDLADRLVTFDLELIDEHRRLLDGDLEAAFAAAHPTILAGLLDLTCEVLAVLPDIRLDRYPRMADFARVLAAVDKVQSTDALGRYLGQAGRIATDVVDSDRVAAAIRDHVAERGAWSGSAGELYETLSVRLPNRDRPPKDWPGSPRGMTAALKRCAPALRQLGVEATDDGLDPKTRLKVYRIQPLEPLDPSEPGLNGHERTVTPEGSPEGLQQPAANPSHNPSPEYAQEPAASGTSETSRGSRGSTRPSSADNDLAVRLPCIVCAGGTLNREDGRPCHKVCAEAAS